jgi:F0F1-type ATP synthase membrane subunit a
MRSPLEQFDIINVKSINTITMDLSFNNILVPFLFTIVIFIFFLFLYNNRFNLISSYFQSIFELIYTFLVGLVKQQAHSYGLF